MIGGNPTIQSKSTHRLVYEKLSMYSICVLRGYTNQYLEFVGTLKEKYIHGMHASATCAVHLRAMLHLCVRLNVAWHCSV